MAKSESTVLAFDIGGTKTAWGVVTDQGKIQTGAEYPTPQPQADFVDRLRKIIDDHADQAVVGVGIAGTVTADHRKTILCPHIPALNTTPLTSLLEKGHDQLVTTLDNDGRCALIGEAWLGAAREPMSTVMITLGTGVGGAVMQKGVVLPHPLDISQEISRLVADPHDLFPATAGPGSVEALIGGRSIAQRFGEPVEEIVRKARKGDGEALEIVEIISGYFHACLRAIQTTYSCKRIIVGGHGADVLDLYLKEEPPCTVIPAELGAKAGLLGAARLALDIVEEQMEEREEWD